MKCAEKKQNTKDDSTGRTPEFTNQRLSDKNIRSLSSTNRPLVPVQPKLKIGRANDRYEQEADRVADRVMNLPETQPVEPKIENVKPTIRGKTGDSEVAADIESRIDAMKGGGQPLPESTRSFFEPRFGHDFSKVKVHADSKASETAKGMNARAFTTGSDIFFGANEYSPGSSSGKRLLAHELTHVTQQKQGNELRLKSIQVGDPELPTKEDLSFTIATILGESSPGGPIGEKLGIAMVIKRRVEEKWKGNTTFKDIILKTGIYGNPNRNALASLAELYLNKTTEDLDEFKKLVDKVTKLREADKKYLKTKGGFSIFSQRVGQCKLAMEFVLEDANFEPDLKKMSQEATWWGGEVDMWNAKTGKFHKHGSRVAKGELVFVIYKEFGKTYFLKEASSIKDEKVRAEEIEKSKEFLCDELQRNTKWKEDEIKKNNPSCK